MKKLTAADPETKSLDLVAENLERLKALFPELVTEGLDGAAVNVDVLKALVGDKTLTDADEKYGLNWHGKRRARQVALTPSTGTLRPCPEDSVDWDTTQNLMIEGDNLEVLKLLQKSYAGKVKLIYIDPPYNTGKDFVYKDDFHDNMNNYLQLTGQSGDDGERFTSNPESSGRFHTQWLNMIYPRLKVARNLLSSDGVIFISIDDHEIAHLKTVCDELFHEENLIGIFKWNRVAKAPSLSGSIRSKYEYIIAYCKGVRRKLFGKESYNTQGPLWHLPNKRTELVFPRNSIRLKESFRKGKYGGSYDVELLDDLIERDGHNAGSVRILAHSAWGQAKIDAYVSEGNTFEIKKSPTTVYTTLSSEGNYIAPSDLITKAECGVGTNTEASDALKEMGIPFDYPKPVSLVQYLCKMVTYADRDALVVDFFAGSGATAHAVMQLNCEDGGSRRYVMIQLPEQCQEGSDASTAGYRTVAELTKARLRSVGNQIRIGGTMFGGDLGFRVFKLDASNIKAWEPDRDNLNQSLLEHAEHLKEGRTEQDILYELLLKLGLDLCVPIEAKTIEGKAVHSVGGGVLLACLAPQITRDEVEPLAQGIVAWHKALAPAGDTTCVFRDSAFADDVAKTNLAAILNQHGLATVRSL